MCSSGQLLCEEEGLPCPLPLRLLWRDGVSIVSGVPDICSDCNGFVVSLLSYCIQVFSSRVHVLEKKFAMKKGLM